MKAADLFECSAFRCISAGVAEPLDVVNVEVTDANEGNSIPEILVEFTLKPPYGINFTIIWWAIPYTDEHRADVTMQDVPAPLIHRRVPDMDDTGGKVVSGVESDPTTVEPNSNSTVKTRDEPISSQVHAVHPLGEPGLCDSHKSRLIQVLNQSIECGQVCVQSSYV